MFRILLLVAFIVATASCRQESLRPSETKDFFNRDLRGQDFGLADKELVLTLDDGPGLGTKKILQFLKEKKIPATFFMVGNQAKLPEHAAIIAEIAADPLFLIANHSLSHTKALTTGTDWAISEIKQADDILYPKMRKGQMLFMRPPYGALIGAEARINSINAAKDGFSGKLSKYIGPIHWDIGGELAKGFGADWACWNKKMTPAACGALYMTEVAFRKKGIILVHDITTQTAEMLVGTAKAPGILSRLIADGYKFVPLDKIGGDALHKKFGGTDTPGGDEVVTPRELDSFELKERPDGFTLHVTASGIDHFSLVVGDSDPIILKGSDVTFEVGGLATGGYTVKLAAYEAGNPNPVI